VADHSTDELWQKVATNGAHEAWVESAYGMVAYFNSLSGYCEGSAAYKAWNEDGTVLVLDRDHYGIAGYLYVLAE